MISANINCLNKNSLLLPIKNKVIFVDWFGVLSEEVFLSKYTNNKSGSFNKRILDLKQSIFKNNVLLQDWMRGNYTYEEVVFSSEIDFSDREYKMIKNSLLNYCSSIQLNEPVLKYLKQASNKAFIVLATDNMDCFFQSLKKLPQLGIFDAVLSSNTLGVLKSDDPHAFFGKWLKNHGLNFKDAILIDDSDRNCQRFIKYGGNAIVYSSQSDSRELDSLLNWTNV